MLISSSQGVALAYNQEKNKLVIIFLDKNDDTIYSIGGWFGKKLHELLQEGDGDLDVFFCQEPFKTNHDLIKTFQRLILTLESENIISCQDNNISESIKLLSDDEKINFGKEKFIGYFQSEAMQLDEIMAEACSSDFDCDFGIGVAKFQCIQSACVPI